MQETGAKVSACQFERVESLRQFAEQQYSVEPKEWDKFYMENWATGVVAWNKLYKKELFSGLRYPIGRINEDEFLTYRLLERAKIVAAVYRELYYYFQNPEGITRSSFSLKNLDVTVALREQCRFAKAKGYREFYYDRMNARLGSIRYLYRTCTKAMSLPERDKKKGLRYLRKELRSVLLTDGKNIAPLNKEHYLYEQAFPTINWLYWTMLGVLGKIKRLVSKDANN